MEKGELAPLLRLMCGGRDDVVWIERLFDIYLLGFIRWESVLQDIQPHYRSCWSRDGMLGYAIFLFSLH